MAPPMKRALPKPDGFLLTDAEKKSWRLKEEEEQLPVSVPEVSAVCVKTEEDESSPLQQTEPKEEETPGEDISAEPRLHSEEDTEHSSYSDEDWGAPLNCSDDGDDYNQVQIRAAQDSELSPEHQSAPESSDTVNTGDKSGTARAAEGKTYQCPVCKKILKDSLQRHMRIHTGERPYSCSTCNKTFTLMGNLNAHRRTHTGEKPFSCSICKKEFTQHFGLRRHMGVHTGETTFNCSSCKKEFTNVRGLKCHMRVHTHEKSFTCSTCNKTFSCNSNLRVHIRTHTGERPYSCSTCHKTFSQMGTLSAHRRTHTGEKPFSCSVCNKTFSKKSNLNKHGRIHETRIPEDA